MSVADIAALFTSSDSKDSVPDVPVEHLDYDYVTGCTDVKELLAILRVLRSGKEGRYFHLEEHVEKRLLDVLPPDKRKQYIALKQEPSNSDVQSAKNDVDAWLSSWSKTSSSSGAPKAVDNTKPNSIESWTPREREFAAGRERQKGNEAFRANETEKAIAHYTKALELVPNDAVVLSNRSQARLKVKQFELAEKDATAAIAADAGYIKAYVRRGNALVKRGRYGLAAADFAHALTLEPENAELKKLHKAAVDKFKEVEGVNAVLPGPGSYDAYVASEANRPTTSKRVAIVESDSEEASDDDDGSNASKQRPVVSDVKPVSTKQSNTTTTTSASKRVTIIESDDDDDDDDEQRHGEKKSYEVPPVPTSASTTTQPSSNVTVGKRVTIVESDSEEEDSTGGERKAQEKLTTPPATQPTQQPKPQPQPQPKATPIPESKPVKSVKPTISGPHSHRVEILSDSDSDAEAESDGLGEKKTGDKVPHSPTVVEEVVSHHVTGTDAGGVDVDAVLRSKSEGNAFFSSGDYTAAVGAYTAALDGFKSQPVLFSNRAMVWLKLGQYNRALEDCDAGLASLDDIEAGHITVDKRLAPTPDVRVKLWYRKGVAYQSLGQLTDALQAFEIANRLGPDNPQVMQGLAQVTEALEVESGKRKPTTSVQPPAVRSQGVKSEKKTGSERDSATVPTPVSNNPPTKQQVPKTPVPQPPPTTTTTTTKTPLVTEAVYSESTTTTVPTSTQPTTKPVRKDKTAEIAARVAKLSSTITVPPPPKSAFDFEKDCRSLVKSPSALVSYLKSINMASFAKLFRSQVDPDLVSAVFDSLAKYGGEGESVEDAADVIYGFIQAISTTRSFDMTVMMFTNKDKAAVAAVVSYVRSAAGDAKADDIASKLRKSDLDTIIVVRTPSEGISSASSGSVDACVVGIDTFRTELGAHRFRWLCCVYAREGVLKCVREELTRGFTFDPNKLYTAVNTEVTRDWERIEKCFEKGDVAKGRKITGHMLRMIAVATQFVTSGAAADFTAGNDVYAEAYRDYSAGYEELRERFEPVGRELLEGLRKACDTYTAPVGSTPATTGSSRGGTGGVVSGGGSGGSGKPSRSKK